MFIRTLDYLSPSVTFYHRGYLSHNSIPSGILSIVTITFVLILAIYYILDIIQRTDPNTFYFNSFVKDAGPIQINSSSLFHFLTPCKNVEGKAIIEEFNFTLFNIIGVNIYYQNYLSITKQVPIQDFDHWLYGPCNKDEDGIGLEDLIDNEIFEKSACIKKYYSFVKGEYFKIGEENFKWPEISHGTFT